MSFDLFKLVYLVAFTCLGLAAVALHSVGLLACFLVGMVAFIVIVELNQF
jgi:hypothetical protein